MDNVVTSSKYPKISAFSHTIFFHMTSQKNHPVEGNDVPENVFKGICLEYHLLPTSYRENPTGNIKLPLLPKCVKNI